MAANSPILGKWKLVSNDRFFEMLERLDYDVPNPDDPVTIEWTKTIRDDAFYQILNFGNREALEEMFTPGESFTSGAMDDRTGTSVITIAGNTLTHKQTIKGPGSKVFEVEEVRVFDGNKMVTTMTAKGVDFKATLNYEKEE